MKEELKSLVKYSSFVGIFCFVLLCIFHHSSTSIRAIFEYAGDAVAFTGLFAFLYEKYIWRYIPFEKHPRLKPSYSGYLLSTYNKKEEKIKVELHLEQSLTTCKVHFKTGESSSNAISADIINLTGCPPALIYTYQNVSSPEFRKESPIHYGMAILFIDKNENLTGTYFTGRETAGKITVFPTKK